MKRHSRVQPDTVRVNALMQEPGEVHLASPSKYVTGQVVRSHDNFGPQEWLGERPQPNARLDPIAISTQVFSTEVDATLERRGTRSRVLACGAAGEFFSSVARFDALLPVLHKMGML